MIIVTGGAGFIGSAFIRRLNDEHIDDIVVVDRLASSEKWRNLSGKRIADYLPANRLPALLTAGALPNIKAIIHLGACSSTTERDAEYMMENNYRYTRELAEWALRHGVRFVYASSGATYGDGARGFSDADDETTGLVPLNVYGFSKHLVDLWALKSGAAETIAGLKFFNVFGPNEYHKGEMSSVVLRACREIRSTGEMKLFKSYRDEVADGEQKRDFVYVKDCCDVLWWMLSNERVSGIYNVGSGNASTWNSLAEAIFAALDQPRRVRYVDMPEAIRDRYQYFTEADISKLRAAGYTKHFTPLEDAVGEYVRDFLSCDEGYW